MSVSYPTLVEDVSDGNFHALDLLKGLGRPVTIPFF